MNSKTQQGIAGTVCKMGQATALAPNSTARPNRFLNVIINTAWLFGDRIFRMAVGVVVTVAIARYLGPEQFGVLSYAVAFVSLFGSFANLGMDNIVVRDLVWDGRSQSEILGSGFYLRLLASVVTTLCCVLSVMVTSQPRSKSGLVILLISLTLLFQSFDVLDLYFQSQIKSKYTVISKNAAFALAAGARLALIHFKASIVLFAASNVLEAFLGALCLWLVYSRTGGSMRSWKYASSRARTLLRESWPLILAGTAILIYMRIDVVMLEHMAGATAVGIYAAATRLSEVWYFIPMAIVSSISPIIMQSRADREIYELRLQQLFSFMVLISVLIAIFISFGYSHLVHLVFGPNYASSAPILAVHIWASVFVFLGVAQVPWDTAESLMRLSLKRTAAGAVVNVILNLILIPRYAGMGAAVATLVAYSLSGVFANVFFAPTRKIFVMQMRSFYLYGCADLFQSAWRILRLKVAHG